MVWGVMVHYSCEVEEHVRLDCFKFVQWANHGGLGLKNTWFRRFDYYGDCGMRFHPHFGEYGSLY